MAYRNGTYVAFHAAGTADPTASDIKYYNLLRAWRVREECDFSFINSHEKTAAVRDTSKRETLRRVLVERLCNSKNMILILGHATRFDDDWVPFEIAYAVDKCKIPIIAAYPGYVAIKFPNQLSNTWPRELAMRIRSGTARVIHVPFTKAPLSDAATQFNHGNFPPGGGLGIYSDDAYRSFGVSL